jgi:hypothetical protein
MLDRPGDCDGSPDEDRKLTDERPLRTSQEREGGGNQASIRGSQHRNRDMAVQEARIRDMAMAFGRRTSRMEAELRELRGMVGEIQGRLEESERRLAALGMPRGPLVMEHSGAWSLPSDDNVTRAAEAAELTGSERGMRARSNSTRDRGNGAIGRQRDEASAERGGAEAGSSRREPAADADRGCGRAIRPASAERRAPPQMRRCPNGAAPLKGVADRETLARQLRAAAGGADLEGMVALLRAGADIHARDGELHTALHYAASSGEEAVVRTLLEWGADVGAKDMWGYTPLHAGIWAGHANVSRLLIASGADVHAASARGTPVELAARCGREDILQVLRRDGP